METLEFSLEEYRGRLERTQALISESGLAALLITTGGSFRYFTGHTTHRWMQTTAPQFAIVPAHGRPWMVLAAIEHSRASENPRVEEVRLYRGYERIGVRAAFEACIEETRPGVSASSAVARFETSLRGHRDSPAGNGSDHRARYLPAEGRVLHGRRRRGRHRDGVRSSRHPGAA